MGVEVEDVGAAVEALGGGMLNEGGVADALDVHDAELGELGLKHLPEFAGLLFVCVVVDVDVKVCAKALGLRAHVAVASALREYGGRGDRYLQVGDAVVFPEKLQLEAFDFLAGLYQFAVAEDLAGHGEPCKLACTTAAACGGHALVLWR